VTLVRTANGLVSIPLAKLLPSMQPMAQPVPGPPLASIVEAHTLTRNAQNRRIPNALRPQSRSFERTKRHGRKLKPRMAVALMEAVTQARRCLGQAFGQNQSLMKRTVVLSKTNRTLGTKPGNGGFPIKPTLCLLLPLQLIWPHPLLMLLPVLLLQAALPTSNT
jgi:hypothetical protein